jgi:hypothetical protein
MASDWSLVKMEAASRLAALACLTLLLVGAQLLSSAETYKQNAQGLEKEFEAFLKAYRKGDDKGMDESFRVFRLPKSKEWFESRFSEEDAAKLEADYDTQLSGAENSFIELMNAADGGGGFRLRCEPSELPVAGKGPGSAGGMQPLKAIPVEQFILEFESTKSQKKFRLVANFVFVDGAYRFVGGGGAPLWVR